jgi:hypothetical protein
MRLVLLSVLSIVASAAVAQDVIIARPRSVVCVNGGCAQSHATVIARRGSLVHSGCGQMEGIGMGSTPEQARRSCCFFGTRPIADEGVAFSPVTRRWYAVIRYR